LSAKCRHHPQSEADGLPGVSHALQGENASACDLRDESNDICAGRRDQHSFDGVHVQDTGYSPSKPTDGFGRDRLFSGSQLESRSVFVVLCPGYGETRVGWDWRRATIILREKQPDGTFRKIPHTFKIRDNGKDLYVHHSSADVAAMYFTMPLKDPFALIDLGFLADDDKLKHYEIHPGDELLCLGYPLAAESNEMGFPILRSGRIASYPLLPTKDIKSFLYDFRVFEGNSGGPVYFSYDTRYFGGALKTGGIEGIVGLVSEQQFSLLPGHNGQPLDLAVIVPAVFIIETINMLPEK
jgi:hypothetical protein